MDRVLAAWRRVPRRVWIPAGLVLVYALLGFLVAPRVIRSQLEKRLASVLHRPVTVREVLFNPFAVSMTVRGFRVAEHDGSTLVGFEELYVDVALLRHLGGGVHVAEIRLVRPEVGIAIEKGGKLSIADLLEGEAAPPAPSEPARKPTLIEIGHFALDRGSLSFADYDRPQPFKARLEPLSIVLDGFTTEPQKNGAYDFKARLEPSTEIAWKGDISMTPPRSSGVISITGLQVAALAPYLSGSTQLRLTEGVLDLRLPYLFDTSRSPPLMTLEDASVKLSRLRVQPPGREETLVTLGALSVEGLAVDLPAQHAKVRSVALEDGRVLARRLADGKLELAGLLGPRTPRPAPSEPLAWTVEVGELRASGLSLQWEDRALETPARLALVDALSLRAGPYGFPGDGVSQVEASMKLLGQGSLAIKGTARPNRGSADLDIALHDLPLAPLQPYAAEAITAEIASGTLRVKGHASFEPGKPAAAAERSAPSRTRFDGDVAVANFSLVDDEDNELAGFEKFELTKLATDTATQETSIAKALIAGARAHYRVNEDETSNWAALVRGARPAEAPVPAAPQAPASATPRRNPPGPQARTSIRLIAIEDLSLDLVDRTVKPQFTARLTQFGGTIAPLTQPSMTKARIDLSGKLDRSRFLVAGTLRPAGKDSDVDVTLNLAPWNLPTTTPYAIRYIAYPVEKGKLSLSLKYKLASRKLMGSNVVTIDQLSLGDSVESPTATRLPVKLALAILTDRSGKLEIDLPVEGDLESPDFRFGGIVLKALLNVLHKAATAPFALLGSLFGSSEDLSFVEFPSGSAGLAQAEQDKLGKLARALADRPALRLSITGLADPESDRQGLLQAALDQLLVARRRAATPAGKTPPSDDDPLSEADRAAGLRVLYRDRVVEAREKQAAELKAQGKPVPPDLVPRREPPLAEMEAAILSTVELTPDDYADLSRERAETVQEELITAHQLAPERIFVAAAKAEVKPKRQAVLQLE